MFLVQIKGIKQLKWIVKKKVQNVEADNLCSLNILDNATRT